MSDEQLSNSDHNEYNDEDTIRIYVSAKLWNEIQRNDGLKNKLKPGYGQTLFQK